MREASLSIRLIQTHSARSLFVGLGEGQSNGMTGICARDAVGRAGLRGGLGRDETTGFSTVPCFDQACFTRAALFWNYWEGSRLVA